MDSHDTLVSLLQLDPSPIVEKPDEKEPEKEPEKAARVGSIYYLARIQKYSSYAFTLFAAIHFANTSVVPLVTRSVAASETYLIQARELYQSPLTEPLLVGLPVVAHVASGIGLRLARRALNMRRYGHATPGLAAQTSSSRAPNSSVNHWPPLSWISAGGYWYMGFLGAHVLVNRALPVAVDGDSANIGLGFVSHGFARHGAVAYAAYAGLIGAGCAHMVWGAAKWLGAAPSTASFWGRSSLGVDRLERKRRRRRWYAVHAVALVAGGAWAAGGLGVVARGGVGAGWVGTLYDGLYARIV